jgi:hypothetical protein
MSDATRIGAFRLIGFAVAIGVAACSSGTNPPTPVLPAEKTPACPSTNSPAAMTPTIAMPGTTTTILAKTPTDTAVNSALAMIAEGRRTFRYETFGDEAFWGGQLRLHEAIAGQANGGAGSGVSPKAALSVGLKVDAEAIPKSLADQIKAGMVNLDDPATTLALLRLNAVVGVTGFFESGPPMLNAGKLTAIGIQCALCHSTVDDSFMPGIGKRLDGWPNRDLDVGAIIAMSPDLTPFTRLLDTDAATVKQVLMSWGPGKFDAELILDGKAFRPDGKPAATLIPAAYGLAGVNLHTYTGWGTVTYWNAFVANLAMKGIGTFFDPRLDDMTKFPVAARSKFGHVRTDDPDADRITPKLAALHFYQLALPAPTPSGGFDKEASDRGDELFNGKAKCGTCHVEPLFTEPGWNLHTPDEIGIDSFQADRSPDRRYRTTPLKGLFARQKGGFFHDGRFASLRAVIEHYNQHFALSLTDQEMKDLEQYLLSL